MPFFSRLSAVVLDASSLNALGGRVSLPASALSELSSEHAFDERQPIVLELRNADANVRTFAGVLDFLAPDGAILLPIGIADACAAVTGTFLAARLAPQDVPPFAQEIVLQPQTGDFYDDVADPAAWLTRALPASFTVVSEGAMLRLPGPGQGAAQTSYDLLVTRVAPKSDAGAVRITDTNVALELMPPADADDPAAPRGRTQVLERGGGGAPVTLTIEAGMSKKIKLLGGKISVPSSSSPPPLLSLKTLSPSSSAAANVSVFMARAPLTHPSLEDHEWAIIGSTGTRLLAASDATRWPIDTSASRRVLSDVTSDEVVHIVIVNNGHVPATIEVNVIIQEGETNTALGIDFPNPLSPSPLPPPSTILPGVDEAICTLCGSCMPSVSLSMHELQCARHRVRCSECHTVLRRDVAAAHAHCPITSCRIVLAPADIPVHVRALHTPHVCTAIGCGATSVDLAAAHRHAHRCAFRIIVCRFCGDAVAAGGPASDAVDVHSGLDAHEAACGARTRVCTTCVPRRAIRLKEWEEHVALLHNNVRSRGTSDAALDAVVASGRSSSLGRASDDEVMTLAPYSSHSSGGVGMPTMSTSAAGGGGGGSTGLPMMMVPTMRAPQCSNAVCAGRASGGVLRLCPRCCDLLLRGESDGGGGGATATATALEHLGKAYAMQLSIGCGIVGCRNLACRTGAPTIQRAAVDAGTALLLETAERGGGIWLCVPDTRRLTVLTPPIGLVVAQVVETTAAGPPASLPPPRSFVAGKPPAAARSRIAREFF